MSSSSGHNPGGRGRGGAGGRSEIMPVPPLDFSRLSVTPSPIPTSTKELTIPQRPGCGQAGRACLVIANHVLVSLQNVGMEIFQYNVEITPESKSTCLNRMIIAELVRSYQQSHLGNLLPAFDGGKNLYIAGELPFLEENFVVNLEREDGSGRERKFTVAVKFAVKLNFDQLSRFLRKNHMECPVDVIQFLNIVLKSSPTENHLSVGRYFFPLDFAPSVQLGNGVECWKGYYQSLRPTQMGLSLNIDVSARSFIQPLNVIVFVEKLLDLKYLENSSMPRSDCTKVRKALEGVWVAVHISGHKIKYRITGISSLPADELMFEGPKGVEISVSQYFLEKYDCDLKYKALPCLEAGRKPSYLPMEICEIVKGQRYVKKLNVNQVRQMLKSTCLRPSDRQRNITQTVCNNGYSNDAFLKEFGLSVDTSLTTVNARVLPKPHLVYKDKSGRETEKQPCSGSWNMMPMQIVKGGIVDGWACLNFSTKKYGTIKRFNETLVRKCQNMGMIFVNTEPLYCKKKNPNNVALALQDVADYFKIVLNNKTIQLMIVVLPDASGLYGKIKTICETDLGIVTQCCKPSKVYECSGQYQESLALKINVKVGGCNTFVSKLKDCFPPLPRVVNQQQAHTSIIFGADVTHPAPGDNTSPSIAAVVASMDWPNVSKYRCLLSSQSGREEIIQDLYIPPPLGKKDGSGMIRDHLVAFYKATGTKPSRILFYRDGVSEGQFQDVLLLEMDAIRKACQNLDTSGGYLPPVTFVVVLKRHRTRLFPFDKSGNVVAGTVVDTKICHPIEFDFYLCSHSGIRGTSRPTHYHVLFDENEFTADQLQILTYSLCYTYARCTQSVSIVPPVYYAHLAAFRARYYIEDEISASTGGGGGAAAAAVLPKVTDSVNSVMFFC